MGSAGSQVDGAAVRGCDRASSRRSRSRSWRRAGILSPHSAPSPFGKNGRKLQPETRSATTRPAHVSGPSPRRLPLHDGLMLIATEALSQSGRSLGSVVPRQSGKTGGVGPTVTWWGEAELAVAAALSLFSVLEGSMSLPRSSPGRSWRWARNPRRRRSSGTIKKRSTASVARAEDGAARSAEMLFTRAERGREHKA